MDSWKGIFIFLLVILFVSMTAAENELVYNKDSYPVLTFNNKTLINSINFAYIIDNQLLTSKITKYGDDNILLDYLTFAHKVAPGIKIKMGPTEYFNKETGKIEVINEGESDWHEIKYETQLEEIDTYLEDPVTYQVHLYSNYKILNGNVSRIIPIILNFGDWPVQVNNDTIDKIVFDKINDNYLLIYGSDKILIICKDNPEFYYKFSKFNGNYALNIEKDIESVENGSLKLYFRPITITYSIDILDFFPDEYRESYRFKPKLKFNISNKNIDKLNFTYTSGKETKILTGIIDENGEISFNDLIDTNGNAFLYPFDSYTSEILVSPPLLISNKKDIEMPIETGFSGRIEILKNKIDITFGRNFNKILLFIFSLIIPLLILFAGIYFGVNPNYALIVFGGALFIFGITYTASYLFSVWSISLVIDFFVGALVILLYLKSKTG